MPVTNKLKARKSAAILALSLVLFAPAGCDFFEKKGVGEFIGLRFGEVLAHKVKVGPRDPPIFHNDLVEFYEIDYPNLEFDFVGVALTKNNEATKKDSVVFNRERVIWAAMMNKRGGCDSALANRTVAFIEKNWKVQVIADKTVSEGSYFRTARLWSPDVLWTVECGATWGLSVVIRDYSVLKVETNDVGRKGLAEITDIVSSALKRKM